jgi:hypothetical protein
LNILYLIYIHNFESVLTFFIDNSVYLPLFDWYLVIFKYNLSLITYVSQNMKIFYIIVVVYLLSNILIISLLYIIQHGIYNNKQIHRTISYLVSHY